MVRLHDYFRSSAAYRVRIALGVKGLAYEAVPWNLRANAHQRPAYRRINAQKLLPALEIDDAVLSQSLAIIEYLEETRPTPPLLPATPAGRARVRSIALAIACDIHPLNNLRVLRHLESGLGQSPEAVNAWYAHWIGLGFEALEHRLAHDAETGRYCHGDTATLADICLVPQVANAERLNLDLEAFPTIRRIVTAARELPAFAAAHPDRCDPARASAAA